MSFAKMYSEMNEILKPDVIRIGVGSRGEVGVNYLIFAGS